MKFQKVRLSLLVSFSPIATLTPIAVGLLTFIVATFIHSATMTSTLTEATGESGILPAASTISISTNTSTISFTPNAAALANSTLQTQTLTTTVSTDSSTGYTLSIRMAGPEQCLRNVADTTANTACSTIANNSQFRPLASNNTPAASIGAGFWGVANPNYSPNLHNPIPSSTDAPWVVREMDSPQTNHQTFLNFAVRADMTTLPGTYTNTVVLTAIANPEPPALIYIQEINQLNCPVQRTMVTDARDYRTYWVQRMPDGRCWMQTNLAYAGGGNNAFGDVVDLWYQATVQDWTGSNFMIPAAANPTDFPTQPSLATDGGVNGETAQFGYMYNWCAAMGGQSGACTNNVGIVDTSVSVCPAGWRLPAGAEFGVLTVAANNNWDDDTDLRIQWLGMRGGIWNGGSFGGAGSFGSYWTTTQNNETEVGNFTFSGGHIETNDGTEKWNGASIRCIAEPVYIQEVHRDNCPEERTMVVDARDMRTYWVQRMPDGECWMQTNLAYAGGGDNTFGDAITGLVENINNSYTEPRFGRPTGANPTTFPQTPSTTTDGGVDTSTRQFGYLYNWCAAMGNQQGTGACMNGTLPAPDQSISVCPAGWRLPTGHPTTGNEFALLNNAANGGLTNTDAGLRTNWLGMYGPVFWNGSFIGAATSGRLWSSTQGSGAQANFFSFFATSVIASSPVDKQFGQSVRCIAEPPPERIYIQEINDINCPTTRTMVVDARDDRTYWVQRMPDGRCWMLTNLAYAGGGDNTFGDVVNIANNETNSVNNTPTFMRPTGANPTTYPTTPSISTTGTGQLGYLYNWCAAMGNQQGTSACAGFTSPLPDPGVSICPAGWRLPTGVVGTGEFAQLNNAVNGGAINTDIGLRTNWLAVYGGIWWGSFADIGTRAVYWSSNQVNALNAMSFVFSSTLNVSHSTTGKGFGGSVRCIAEPIIFMQNINDSNCPEERTMVVDARDMRTYWVQRMEDGRCWTLTNLAYAGGGDNTFGDAVELENNEVMASYTQALFMRPTPSSGVPLATTFPNRPSLEQFGYAYNWCAAMGNQQGTRACMSSTFPNHDMNMSVCPAGWRLPTGDSGSSEFVSLAGAGGHDSIDDILFAQWLGVLSGWWWWGSSQIGQLGYYWSSTQWLEAGNAGAFILQQGSASGMSSLDKQSGSFVRCITQ